MVNGQEGAWLMLRDSIGKCEQMVEVKARDDRMMAKWGLMTCLSGNTNFTR
jgi:hypothetical protein